MTAVRTRLPARVVADLRRIVDNAGVADSGSPLARDEASASAWLYEHWYTAQPSGQAVMAPDWPEFVSALRAAPAAADRWDRGWVVMQRRGDGACVAATTEQSRLVEVGDYANVARPGLPPEPGDALAIRGLVDWVEHQTGFWFVQSSDGPPRGPLVRTYWSVDASHAVSVIHELTDVLDRERFRYTLKCPCIAAAFTRVDSVICYHESAGWSDAQPIVVHLARRIRARLRPFSPPLTLRLARGLAFAEDPGQELSFGESRCRALAPAVVRLQARRSSSPRPAMRALVGALEVAGLDPARPWRSHA